MSSWLIDIQKLDVALRLNILRDSWIIVLAVNADLLLIVSTTEVEKQLDWQVVNYLDKESIFDIFPYQMRDVEEASLIKKTTP